MAYSLGTVVIKDGNGTAITGAVNEIDTSGTGAGPYKFAQAIIDGAGLANAATTGATVKAGSQNPVPADQALVVAISPNGQNPNGQASGSASAPVVGASDWKEVVGITSPIAVTVPGVTTTTYTSGKEVGTLITFAGTGRSPNNAGLLMDVTITSTSIQTSEFDLYIFNSNPSNTTWTDNSTPAINSADVSKLITVCKLTKNYSGLGTHTVYKPDLTTWAFVPYSGLSLYGILVAPAGTSAALAANQLVATLGVKQD